MNDPIKIKVVVRLFLHVYENFRQLIVMVLMMVLMVAIAVAVGVGLVAFTTELAKPLSAKTVFLSLRKFFASVLLVLLGLGLIESVKVYLMKNLYLSRWCCSWPSLLYLAVCCFRTSDGRSALADRACAVLLALTGGYFLLTKALKK